jgi:hypothetical protein
MRHIITDKYASVIEEMYRHTRTPRKI